MSRLTFLGAGDSQGVPRWWCDCPVCSEARSTGANRRNRPSALLESGGKRILLDAGPEFRTQAISVGLRSLDALVLTHAHNDHILGLGDFTDWLRWTDSPANVFVPGRVLDDVRERFSYLFRGPLAGRFRAIPDEGLSLAGWRLSAFEVPHGFNGTAHALRFERPGRSWVYMPDALNLPEAVAETLRGLDLLVLGTSFWREEAPVATRSVYDVTEALSLIRQLGLENVVFTHLGHGVDQRDVHRLPQGRRFASDGMTIELCD